MHIINTNINIINTHKQIINNNNHKHINKLHKNTLLILSQKQIININNTITHHLHNIQQKINLPLQLKNKIINIINLTNKPKNLHKYNKLIYITTKIILKQSQLIHLLTQNNHLQKKLIINLIQTKKNTPTLTK